MKVLHVNTSHLSGGAARAALRLHDGLTRLGVESLLRVQSRDRDDPSVRGGDGGLARLHGRFRLLLDQLPVMYYRNRTGAVFAPSWVPDLTWKRINADGADLVHLHWFTKAFLRTESLLRLRGPLVWTLHDMWAFTGGCHYDEDCGRYRSGCGACPVLGSRRERDLSSWNCARKHRTFSALDLTVVTPSHWLARCARDSRILGRCRIEVIPNGIDLELYRGVDAALARRTLGLPEHGRIVLFGAMDATGNRRKGFHLLSEALQRLGATGRAAGVQAVVFGSAGTGRRQEPGMPLHYLGNLDREDQLVAAYSAADVFVAPSLQENLSNSVLEALACGTPVVAFDTGGMPDMIVHRDNGYLARVGDAADLAAGIDWVLAGERTHAQLSRQARHSVETGFDLRRTAHGYQALYQELLAARA